MSGALAVANPRRIKAAHRRRRKVASGPIVQRYYDPQIGRFLSVDPVTANGNTGANFNRYWYANNNPFRFIDPDGRAPDDPERVPNMPLQPRNLVDNRTLASKSVGLARGMATTAAMKSGRGSVGEQIRGAVADFNKARNEMVDANVIGADKFFHCKANCEAASRGTAGETTAGALSAGRELTDNLRISKFVEAFKKTGSVGGMLGERARDTREDLEANSTGRVGAGANDACSACDRFRVNGLDPEY